MFLFNRQKKAPAGTRNTNESIILFFYLHCNKLQYQLLVSWQLQIMPNKQLCQLFIKKKAPTSGAEVGGTQNQAI